eukprot:9472885-Pyramimonas_sp.AAC.3
MHFGVIDKGLPAAFPFEGEGVVALPLGGDLAAALGLGVPLLGDGFLGDGFGSAFGVAALRLGVAPTLWPP